jgi:hypothetical protein
MAWQFYLIYNQEECAFSPAKEGANTFFKIEMRNMTSRRFIQPRIGFDQKQPSLN